MSCPSVGVRTMSTAVDRDGGQQWVMFMYKGVGASHFRPSNNEDTRGHFEDTLRLIERSPLGVCPITTTRIALTKFTKKERQRVDDYSPPFMLRVGVSDYVAHYTLIHQSLQALKLQQPQEHL